MHAGRDNKWESNLPGLTVRCVGVTQLPLTQSKVFGDWTAVVMQYVCMILSD